MDESTRICSKIEPFLSLPRHPITSVLELRSPASINFFFLDSKFRKNSIGKSLEGGLQLKNILFLNEPYRVKQLLKKKRKKTVAFKSIILFKLTFILKIYII